MIQPIDYTAPGCNCAVGGMGRRADCPVHGITRINSAQAEYARECSTCRAQPGQPCRNTTTGYWMSTSHAARRVEEQA